MKTVWKFPLLITNAQTISMPAGAQVLSVQAQNNEPQLWALVDSSVGAEERMFHTVGTGHAITEPLENLRHIGSYQVSHGALVFHVFEVAA